MRYGDHRGGYPVDPGFKARDTARAAAEGIKPVAGSLRARVYDAIKARPGTPEEIADRLGVPLMNVRPRCSELAARDLIVDSGERRLADGGRQAIVWKVSNAPS
jgi:predicted ArsR family transcriptional regulator